MSATMTLTIDDARLDRLRDLAQRRGEALNKTTIDVFDSGLWVEESSLHRLSERTEAYSEQARQDGEISDVVMWRTGGFLRTLYQTVPGLPHGVASIGGRGNVLLSWNNGARHIELEVADTGDGEPFAMNRAAETTWDVDWVEGAPLSEAAQRQFRSAFDL